MVNEDTLLALHREMVRIRIFEETLVAVYQEGKSPAFDIAAGPVPGEMHLAAGQEPVAAGVCAHLRPTDAVTATHRPHHVALAHGVDMKRMAAEIFGKETGLGRGKGGHMHLFSAEPVFGCSGIIAEASRPPLVTPWRSRSRDATTSPSRSSEKVRRTRAHSTNRSTSRVCGTCPWCSCARTTSGRSACPRDKATAISNNSDRAAAYGMPGVLIPDNDPVAIYETAEEAVERARGGGGPSLIEIKTDRLLGHFEGDPQVYRTAEELETLRQRDAVKRFERQLLDAGVISEGDVKQVWEDARAEVDEAIAFARSSP